MVSTGVGILKISLNYIFLLIVILYFLIRFYFSIKLIKKHNIYKRHYTVIRIVKNFGYFLQYTVIPFIWVYTNIFDFFQLKTSSIIQTVVIFIGVANTLFFYIIHNQLMENFSPYVEVFEKQKLVTTGVYKYIRHPMYLQLLIYAVFIGLYTQNFLIFIIEIVGWCVMYINRIQKEEQILEDKFKEEYIEYKMNTPRLFPSLKFISKQIRKL